MKRSSLLMMSSVLFLLAAVSSSFAAAVQEEAAKQEDEVTLTGCLTKGEEADTYVLTDPKTKEETTVTGSADLAKHAENHTVRLTGAWEKEGDEKVFKVSNIEHIAAECKAPTE